MYAKRVLLIESGKFIGGIFHNLIADQDRLKVIEASPSSTRELLRAVKFHRPEIIVLDDTVREDYLAHLLHYMQSSEGIRVIVVNTNSNQVDVYEKQQVNVERTADFLAVL